MSFVADLTALVAASVDHRHCCPDGWSRVPLGSVAKIINGFPFKSGGFGDKGYPVIRIRDVTRGYTTTRFDGDAPNGFWVDAGDLIVGMDGDFQTAFWRSDRALLNQRVCKIVPDASQIDRRYLAYILPGYLALINANTPSITVKHLSSRTLASIPLPLPPLERQQSIADRIDELFAEVDDGEAALALARDDLATWRKALLKAAVTGKLTADWRAANQPTETGADLLVQILATRDSEPKPKSKQTGKATHDEGGIESSLPVGWGRCEPNQIVEWSSGKFMPDRSMNGGVVPVYGGNGIAGYHDAALVAEPTLVIGRVGHYCGNAYTTDGAAWISDNAIYASKVADGVAVHYLRLVFEQVNLRRLAQGGAQPFVSQNLLNSIAIPLPSRQEQAVILEAVQSGLTEAIELEHFIDEGAAISATLRQSILAAAFRGDLA